MAHTITERHPVTIDGWQVYLCGWDRSTAEVLVGDKIHSLKTHYRHERTWDDHMGNTPCGYYTNVPVGRHTYRCYLEGR